MTLTEFLLARIAEDEAAARAAIERNGATWTTHDLDDGDGYRINGTTEKGNPRDFYGVGPELWDDEGALGMWPETAQHIARHDPARVLADCEAKRSTIDRLQVALGDDGAPYEWADDGGWPVLCWEVLCDLAVLYADHPDYDQAWKPS